MSITPEDRLWQQLFDRLSRIENKLDRKIDVRDFQDHKRDTETTIKEVANEFQEHIDDLTTKVDILARAAVTPEQVATWISEKLREADAQGLTRRDRWIRWTVALTVIVTFVLTVYDKVQQGGH